jgi:hypothetical protein
MRWKLLVLVSIIAALLALALWSVFTIGIFGSARAMARSDATLLASLLIPLSISIFAGVFVYRHTARKRRTQAIVTVLLSALLMPVVYEAAWATFPARFYIPRTYEVRHAR